MILFVSSKRMIMKRLFNISPFILLLIPVFIMTLFTVIPSNRNNENRNEASVKTEAGISAINVSNNLTK